MGNAVDAELPALGLDRQIGALDADIGGIIDPGFDQRFRERHADPGRRHIGIDRVLDDPEAVERSRADQRLPGLVAGPDAHRQAKRRDHRAAMTPGLQRHGELVQRGALGARPRRPEIPVDRRRDGEPPCRSLVGVRALEYP